MRVSGRRCTEETHQIQASAPFSSSFTVSEYAPKSSQTTDLNVAVVPAAFSGGAVSRRARATTEVMDRCRRAWLTSSVPTKPVAPAMMSFIVLFGECFDVCWAVVVCV